MKKPDKFLFYLTLFASAFGLLVLGSASIGLSQERFDTPYFYLTSQFFPGFLLGMVSFFIFQRFNYEKWKMLALPMFFASVVLLAMTLTPWGVAYGGEAKRWLDIGLVFQPSEVVKLTFIVYLAAVFSKKGREISSLHEGLIPFAALAATVGIIIFLQPDLGTLGVISITALTLFFIAGSRPAHALSLFFAGIAFVAAAVKLAPYRMNRITSFLNPDIDPLGIGYQIKQALIALGSGGILGVGLGESRQKFLYLPEPMGDSIFAIAGEELGFLGTTIIVTLFLIMAWRGYRVAKNAPDNFGKLLAVGITTWITVQALINIAAVSGLLPLTGIPLPFFSYGGTSLVVTLSGMGILLNISRYSKIK